ncbi:MAG: hypothetical protein QNL01_07270 [Akkermansiaceae bacterium]|jgi:hypothetical protein|tara:strand:+ start:842 stop:1033 length:192 start_codon:yes stop_codon:yes gene_type:complete
MFVSEREALNLIFSKQVRPSLRVWQKYRRQLDLPAYKFGRRIIYDDRDIEETIEKLKAPKPVD